MVELLLSCMSLEKLFVKMVIRPTHNHALQVTLIIITSFNTSFNKFSTIFFLFNFFKVYFLFLKNLY